MTERILDLFRQRVKPLADPDEDRRYTTAVGQAIRLGDRERELNRWRDDYRIRTGRAA